MSPRPRPAPRPTAAERRASALWRLQVCARTYSQDATRWDNLVAAVQATIHASCPAREIGETLATGGVGSGDIAAVIAYAIALENLP